ncbi:TetR/AcrR family transcriptional regulator [Pseudomonas lijiangensis]|uniref:TetR/AcrR family transcriptional regulator n=1 Tax=Pseudomonas lijiangensis TaxID=2995658 RepID=UPI0031BA711A
MDTIENKRPRGRPKGFELEPAIRLGQDLFHEHGYESVSVASISEAIGITPPSFYAAFKSKTAFFEDALRLYSATAMPLERFLTPGQSPLTALTDMLKVAALTYAAHPQRRGCLLLEHARSEATEWGISAARIVVENRDKVRAFLEESHVPFPERPTDYVAAIMLGLSAASREGWDSERLSVVAEAAAAGLDQFL